MNRLQQFTIWVLSFFATITYSQNPDLSVSQIDDILLNNVHSVVRLDQNIINIPDRTTIEIEKKRIVTVLDKKGNDVVRAYVHYDDVTRVKELSAVVYDKTGKELKKYSKRDFEDVAAVDGISLFTDSRIKYLNYTPTNYPYTVIFEVATISKNTAFLPSFYANSDYYSSTEKGYFEINYKADLGLRSKYIGPEGVISTNENPEKNVYEVQNIPSIKPESFSPGFQNIVSKVILSLDYFHLEGVDGEATSWKSFGKWMDTYLLSDTQEIPETTKEDIKKLVANVDNVPEKVRLIYEYMQDRTRYISIQVGIGGWKPMLASEVDELGYGDCKALSNYTKSLLDVAGIPSYYTILYGGDDKRDIQKDFPSLQGNHAILAVPIEDDYIWLECTSQSVPYGFIADFTDDRDVLIVTPDGGEIVHTKIYEEQDNSQLINGSITLSDTGDLSASVTVQSQGTQYDDSYFVGGYSKEDQKTYYYDLWDYVNNMSIESIKIDNEKENALLTEEVSFEAKKYATFAGEEMLVTLNALNRFRQLPNKNRNRQHDIEIDRGFYDEDEVRIYTPSGMEPNELPEDVTISNTYGTYKYSVRKVNENELLYKRTFILNEGYYSKEKYEEFRKFLKNVVKHDNQKIVLKKI